MDLFKNIYDITKSIALIALIILAWFYGGNIINSLSESNQISKELMTLEDSMIILSNIKSSDEKIKNTISKLENRENSIIDLFKLNQSITKEKLDEIGELKAELKQIRKLYESPDKRYENKTKDIMNYEFKKVYAKDDKGKEFPIAWVMYFPNKETNERWKTGTYPLDYHTNIIESENSDGTFNRYAEMYIKNDQMKETKGKEFSLKLTDIKWSKVERNEKNFHFWNPRLSLGVCFTREIYPNLGISLISYGKTEVDMDWKFLTLGLGINNSEDLVGYGYLEPVSWNIGLPLPLVKNMFVGPIIGYNTEMETNFGINGSIPF